jgi:hypothetical protein
VGVLGERWLLEKDDGRVNEIKGGLNVCRVLEHDRIVVACRPWIRVLVYITHEKEK